LHGFYKKSRVKKLSEYISCKIFFRKETYHSEMFSGKNVKKTTQMRWWSCNSRRKQRGKLKPGK
jgi:hypothetical protein